MTTQDLSPAQAEFTGSALRLFTDDELRQITPAQRLALNNMLGERLRRNPPPTPAEVQGIKQLADQAAKGFGAP